MKFESNSMLRGTHIAEANLVWYVTLTIIYNRHLVRNKIRCLFGWMHPRVRAIRHRIANLAYHKQSLFKRPFLTDRREILHQLKIPPSRIYCLPRVNHSYSLLDIRGNFSVWAKCIISSCVWAHTHTLALLCVYNRVSKMCEWRMECMCVHVCFNTDLGFDICWINYSVEGRKSSAHVIWRLQRYHTIYIYICNTLVVALVKRRSLLHN